MGHPPPRHTLGDLRATAVLGPGACEESHRERVFGGPAGCTHRTRHTGSRRCADAGSGAAECSSTGLRRGPSRSAGFLERLEPAPAPAASREVLPAPARPCAAPGRGPEPRCSSAMSARGVGDASPGPCSMLRANAVPVFWGGGTVPHGAGERAAALLPEDPPSLLGSLAPSLCSSMGGHSLVTPILLSPSSPPKTLRRRIAPLVPAAPGEHGRMLCAEGLMLATGAVPLPAHMEPRGGGEELGTVGTTRRGAWRTAEQLFDGKKIILCISGTCGMQGMEVLSEGCGGE